MTSEKFNIGNVLAAGLAIPTLGSLGWISYDMYKHSQQQQAIEARQQAADNAPVRPLTPEQAVSLNYVGGTLTNEANQIVGLYFRNCLAQTPYDPNNKPSIRTSYDLDHRLIIIDTPASSGVRQLPLRFFGFSKNYQQMDLTAADHPTAKYLNAAGCEN